MDRVNSIALHEGYAVYNLEDVDFETLPTNQVELFFTLISKRHILKEKKTFSSPYSKTL